MKSLAGKLTCSLISTLPPPSGLHCVLLSRFLLLCFVFRIALSGYMGATWIYTRIGTATNNNSNTLIYPIISDLAYQYSKLVKGFIIFLFWRLLLFTFIWSPHISCSDYHYVFSFCNVKQVSWECSHTTLSSLWDWLVGIILKKQMNLQLTVSQYMWWSLCVGSITKMGVRMVTCSYWQVHWGLQWHSDTYNK